MGMVGASYFLGSGFLASGFLALARMAVLTVGDFSFFSLSVCFIF